jgi:predicted RNase H-like HicB family nuclease
VSQEPRTYTLTVVLEPEEDEMWHAYCPTLLDYGAWQGRMGRPA